MKWDFSWLNCEMTRLNRFFISRKCKNTKGIKTYDLF